MWAYRRTCLYYIYNFIWLFKNIYNFIYLFGCGGSLLLLTGFLYLQWAGSSWRRGFLFGFRSWVSLGHRGFSSCGAWYLERGLSNSWHTGLVACWHVGSSQTRGQTCVPCIGRWVLNHRTTREVPVSDFVMLSFKILEIPLGGGTFNAVKGLLFHRHWSTVTSRAPPPH